MFPFIKFNVTKLVFRQYREVFVRCSSYSWPKEAKSPESLPSSESSTPPLSPSPPSQLSSPHVSSGASDDSADLGSWDSRPEADLNCHFNEGAFLSMLIARLENLPYQAHEINLQATALVSRLALLPHPHLHEWLLNPLLKINSGCHTIYLALCNAAHEMEAQVPAIPDFQRKLSNTRKILLGGAEDETIPKLKVGEEEIRMLESVIVLEEFCKELAAIAFVKYHYSS
ncbi:hypothetical protein J437_LFUL005907 [Ladona fulva]|uniref:FHF complex subunit HOOK-interacting protein C-terminal domain-containing protein n=1 Tax=Ladona fulva TaxID=123851 RepID=A0A8K0KBB3_LADFU|nr:hypothetical protein J437_LFUL005907 [Ladona fulva]